MLRLYLKPIRISFSSKKNYDAEEGRHWVKQADQHYLGLPKPESTVTHG